MYHINAYILHLGDISNSDLSRKVNASVIK